MMRGRSTCMLARGWNTTEEAVAGETPAHTSRARGHSITVVTVIDLMRKKKWEPKCFTV